MGKLYNALQKQLKIEEYKKDAEDCLKLCDELQKIDNGKIWRSHWESLVSLTFIGKYPNITKIYRPTQLGYIFLKGCSK